MFPRSFSLLCVVMSVGGTAQGAVIIETVPVGNPGNPNDTRYRTPGYGGVDYAYSIGKYEVTAGQYTEFLNAVADTDTYGLYNTNMTLSQGCQIQRSGSSGRYTYSVASDWANRPVNYVSWGDAVRFANWLHNGQPTGTQDDTTTEDGAYDLNGAMTHEELALITQKSGASWYIPSLSEWFKAAYHKNNGVTGDYWDYPTSSDTAPLNTVVDPDPGNNANFYDESSDTYTVGSPYWTTEVGEFENSESPYGTFDQGGNIWEWTTSGGRALGGGAWAHDSSIMHASEYWSVAPAYEGGAVGFRMASSQVVPAPSSFVAVGGLLGMGFIASWWRRRRKRWNCVHSEDTSKTINWDVWCWPTEFSQPPPSHEPTTGDILAAETFTSGFGAASGKRMLWKTPI